MKKYYVHYVDNCTPTLKKFKTLKSAKDFVTKFRKKHPETSDDWWVDYIVKGEIEFVDEYYRDQI